MHGRTRAGLAPNVDPAADGLDPIREPAESGTAVHRRAADTIVAHLDRETATVLRPSAALCRDNVPLFRRGGAPQQR